MELSGKEEEWENEDAVRDLDAYYFSFAENLSLMKQSRDIALQVYFITDVREGRSNLLFKVNNMLNAEVEILCPIWINRWIK